ncbi:MAG: RNA-binding protein [Pseudomonadota bacterium]
MLAAQDSVQDNELDAGPRSGGSGTERFCVVTRTVKPIDELIRFVVGPDGVVPDLKRKLPGRGLWITADRKILADAITRKAFARGFKREVKVPSDLGALTEQLLVQFVLDALAIAGKAGLVPAGFAKTEAALMRDRIVGLLHASEAAPDGVKKLTGVLKSRPDADRIAVIRAFSSAQLDLALGRANVVHAALLAGPPSDTFLARFQRLERFRTGDSGESGTSRTPN